MTQRFFTGEPLQRVRAEQTPDEVPRLRADVAPRIFVKFKISGQDFFEKRFVGVRLVGVGVKRRVAGKEDVGDDADAPHVGRRRARLTGDHFRGEISGRPADWGTFFQLPLVFRETEICHLGSLL